MNKDHFDIDADLFLRVRRAQGIEEVRYYLTGVLIEPHPEKGAWLVATDGRAMLVGRDETAIVPRAAAIALTMPETPPPNFAACDFETCAMSAPSYVGARLTFDAEPKAHAVASIGFTQTTICRPVVHDLGCADRFPGWRKAWREPKAQDKRRWHQGYGLSPGLLHRISGGDAVSLETIGDGYAMRVIFNRGVPLAGLMAACDLAALVTSREVADGVPA